MTGVVGSGLDQIIDNHVGRAQHVLPTHPAASGNLEQAARHRDPCLWLRAGVD